MAGIRPGNYNQMKPDIELFDYKSKKRYGLKLDGPSALQIGTISQDDTVHIRTQGKRVGDFDEQRSWKGGRGHENLSSNPTGYWDAANAWTLSDGHVHQTLQWEFARGLRSAEFFMPDKTHSMGWKSLLVNRFVSIDFAPLETFAADYVRMWFRKVGNPGDLTLNIHSNSAGDPGTVLKTVVFDADEVTDVISELLRFDWTSTESLTAATTYHISVEASSGDNKTNHWEIGGYSSGVDGKHSSDGSTWSVANFDIYYFIGNQDISRTFFSFVLDNAFYVVDKRDSGAASRLWINGDRGKATSGSTTTIVDTGKSWVVDRWAGAWVKIVRGTGPGQIMEVLSNTATTLTLNGTLDIAAASGSEYIIYGTPWFTEVLTTGLAKVESQPLVVNQIVYFPQGTSNTRRMIWNAATPAHSFSDDGTNKAAFMISTNTPTGIRVWRIINGVSQGGAKTLDYAAATAWATSPTNLSFANSVPVGDATHFVTGVVEKDSILYIMKEDGIWSVSSSGTIVKLQAGIEKTPSPSNGLACVSHQQFIYYSWLHSAVRVYGSSHDDIGQDWSGYGLPDGREGNFSSFDTYISLLIGGVDAGSGRSSVLGWDGIGWHEIFRAYDDGRRIRFVKIQTCEGTRNRTWFDVGGDLVFQILPLQKSSPRLDNGVRYYHEAVVESSAIDMGTASGLPKFIKGLTVYCENLGDDNEIYVDYQIDDDIQTSNWTEATVLYESPESFAFLGLSDIRKFAYRLRIISRDNTNPVDVIGVVPNGYARVPYKMVWTMRCRADNIISKGRLVKPDVLMRWLLDNARYPGRVEMRSQYELAHKFYVIIHPPRMFPYKPAQFGQAEESVFTLTLEEG